MWWKRPTPSVDGQYTSCLYVLLEKGIVDFDFEFPWYDNSPLGLAHKASVIEKWKQHYKYREIGFETYGMFVDRLVTAWKEVIPIYNKMWEVQKQLIPEDIMMEWAQQGDNTNYFADAPNTKLTAEDITNHNYATTYTNTNARSSGRNSSQIDLYRNYIDKLIDIDYEFITDKRFENLFMGVF